jgi:hypothetical protein
MAVKVYNRKGNISLKEKAMVRELEKAVLKLQQEDPNFQFKPANNPSELEGLYNEYAVTDIDFVEVKSNLETESKIVEDFKKETGSSMGSSEKLIDPFNREEPIVRDYVLNEEFADETTQSTKSSFDEPLSFDESFTIPESETLGHTAHKEEKGFVEPEQSNQNEPMNPAYGEMDSAKQRKKTKRFAKQIVAITCDLLEKGFEWYAMKDISEAKLTEYELNDEMDLSLLLDMPNGQQSTVKAFFLSQHQVIKDESKIDAEDREDLGDALTEVLLEKGIAPTPMQDLLLVGAKIVGLQLLKVVGITNSNKSILTQLRGMKQEEVNYDDYNPTPEPPKQTKRQPEQYAQEYRQPTTPSEVVETPIASTFEEVMFPIEVTKE